jgi:hypothetical protein
VNRCSTKMGTVLFFKNGGGKNGDGSIFQKWGLARFSVRKKVPVPNFLSDNSITLIYSN